MFTARYELNRLLLQDADQQVLTVSMCICVTAWYSNFPCILNTGNYNYAPTTLFVPEKQQPVLTEQDAGWVQQPVQTIWRTDLLYQPKLKPLKFQTNHVIE